MAKQPQLTAEGATWDGVFASGNIPERLMEGNIDTSTKLAFITRHNNKFLQMIHSKFPSSKMKKTREFRVSEIEELDRTFTVRVASADTNHTTFGLSNEQAAQITENDILIRRGLYATVAYNNMTLGQKEIDSGTDVGPDLVYPAGGNPTAVNFSREFGLQNGVYYVDNETMRVTNVGDKDSGGTGFTNVTVRRCYFAPSGQDQGGQLIPESIVNTSIQAATANVVGFTEGDVLVRSTPTFKEGTGAPNGYHKVPILDNNFTQEFKYAVEMTRESEIDAKAAGLKPLDLRRKLAARRMNLDMERMYLFGRKAKDMDAQGKATYNTGGVVEFIPKDERHIITYGSPVLNYGTWQDVGYQIFDVGGGAVKECFVGVKLYNEIKKSFEGHSSFRFNKEDSKNYDFPIESIYVSGGQLNLIPLHCMDEMGWGSRALCLDLTVPSFVPVTHKNWDMKIEKDIGEKGTQIYKEQIIGIKGLERRYSEYHTILDFGSDIVN